MSAICVCCSNVAFIDGEDLTVKSNRALVLCVNDGNKETGKVEIRVTLTNESAAELIAQIQARFPITRKG
jgi:hypothetical protein